MADIIVKLVVSDTGSVQKVTAFGSSLKQLGGEAATASKSLLSFGTSLKTAGERVSSLGTSLIAITTPLALISGGAVKMAATFEAELTKIVTLVGLSRQEVEGFREEIFDLASVTGQAPTELAGGLYAVTSAGATDAAQAIDILTKAAQASAIGLGDTKEVALAVTAAMQAYGSENLSAATATDVLIATVQQGNLEASELAGTLGRVIGIASQVGVSFQDVGGFLATFSRLGVDSAEAVTALRGVLSTLLKPSKEANDTLAMMGTSVGALRDQIREEGLAQTLIELVESSKALGEEAIAAIVPNVRALAGVLGTAGSQSEKFLEIQEKVRDSAGALATGFAEVQKNTAFTFSQFAAEAEIVAIKFGNALAPALKSVLESAKPLLQTIVDLGNKFAALSPETQESIIKMVAFGVAMGPVLFIGGNLIKMLGFLTTGVGQVARILPSFGTAAVSASSVATKSLAGVGTSVATMASTAGVGFERFALSAAGAGKAAGTLAGTGAGGIGAIGVAAAAATLVISSTITRALDDLGDKTDTTSDHIEDAVEKVGLLRGAWSLFPDVASGALRVMTSLGQSFVDIAGRIPFVGVAVDALSAAFNGLKSAMSFVGGGIDALGDAIARNTEFLFAQDNAARDATTSTAQLYQASRIAGETITDQGRAVEIINDHLAKLRQANADAAEKAKAASEALKNVPPPETAPGIAVVTEEMKKFQEELAKTAAAMGKAGLAKDAADLEAALRLVGGVGGLTKSAIAEVGGEVKTLRENSVPVPPLMAEVAHQFNMTQVAAEMLNAPLEMTSAQMRAVDEELKKIPISGGQTTFALGEIVGGLTDAQTQAVLTQNAIDNFNIALDMSFEFLSNLGNGLKLFGLDIDNVVNSIGRFISSADSLLRSIGGIISLLSGNQSILSQGLGGLFGAATGGGGGILGTAAQVGLGVAGIGGGGAAGIAAATGGEAVLGGVGAAGAGAGGVAGAVSSGVSSVVGAVAPVLAAIPVAGWVALGAIGVGLLVKSLLGGRDAETVMQEAGRDLGVSLSEGLAKSIHEGGKNVQLSLSQIFQEAGAEGFGAEGSSFNLSGLDRFAEETGDIFSGIELGWFSVAEATGPLQENLQILIENFSLLGEGGQAQLERILVAAEQYGVKLAELDQLQEMLGQSASMSGKEAVSALRESGLAIDDNMRKLIKANADVIASFEDVGGSFTTLTEHLEKESTNAERALSRLARILARLEAGKALGETQTRFLGKVGVQAAQHGFFGMVDRPTLFMTGEGNRPEHVAITPSRRLVNPAAARLNAAAANLQVMYNPTIRVQQGDDDRQTARKIVRAVRGNIANLEGEITRAMRRKGDLSRR